MLYFFECGGEYDVEYYYKKIKIIYKKAKVKKTMSDILGVRQIY